MSSLDDMNDLFPDAATAPVEPHSGADAEIEIDVRDLRVEGQPGASPGPVSFRARAGDLVCVRGPAGSGKTALLLTLGGRMKPVSGEATVLGSHLPRKARHVRAQAALALMRGVNDLDTNLRVDQHIAERLILQRPWYKPWVSRASVRKVIDLVNTTMDEYETAHETSPATPRLSGTSFPSETTPLEQFFLGIVLAMIGKPRILLVDDLDGIRDPADRHVAWRGLLSFLGTADSPTTIVTCEDDAELLVAMGVASPDTHLPSVHRLRLSAPDTV